MKYDKITSLKIILIVLILTLFIRNFLFNVTIVNGSSMEPTLSNKSLVFSIVPKKHFIKRGDIVILKAPDKKYKKYIKRVIGLPNDEVQIKNGKVYINGDLYEENYISTDYTEAINGTYTILKENEYFVLGDNREPGKSEDSRYFGPIDKRNIKSVIIFRIYPFRKF
ncbi:signal peptidase I [Anaerosphaera multitolerans]|uniref:Signal peptidase I n=1 Tax=Anaerosphaera multitolerans TaxID=2487351 RepID=A0A437S8C1_9FIRM|nr:signal peptidase I [Anaerosphaera multitolerans]RVU55340.1 signal peptidase I [Anaerosphaera multitolerans]